MQEDKVYVIDYVFHSKRQTAWNEFKKAIEDETSFSKSLKLNVFYGRIDTEDDSFLSADNDYDNDYESKTAFASLMFSLPVNTIEEITYTSFYQGITTSVGYMETVFGDSGIEKYYRDDTYQPK
ncbi:MAG: hypothetical protein IJ759_03680 [Bacteroidales bacterium]|nr:hypothetical protein [Bacteroidales bacterium]